MSVSAKRGETILFLYTRVCCILFLLFENTLRYRHFSNSVNSAQKFSSHSRGDRTGRTEGGAGGTSWKRGREGVGHGMTTKPGGDGLLGRLRRRKKGTITPHWTCPGLEGGRVTRQPPGGPSLSRRQQQQEPCSITIHHRLGRT